MDDLSLAERTWSITAANGVAYGAARQAAAWGSAGGPLVPRAYRQMYGEDEAPTSLRLLIEDPGLTLGDLDASCWDRLFITELPKRHQQIISRELGRLPYPAGRIAIPAGLPLAWVAELPLRTRTSNAIQRFIEQNGEGSRPDVLKIDDVMSWRAVGTTTLIDLLCVIESAELTAQSVDLDVIEAPQSQNLGADVVDPPRSRRIDSEAVKSVQESVDDDPSIDRSVPWLPDQVQQLFYDIAAWAVLETDSVTLGDAFAKLMSKKNTPREWNELTQLRLAEITELALDPHVALDEWAGQLLPREARIFRARLAARPGSIPTLEKMGNELGITRERLRQLEQGLIAQLRLHIRDGEGQVIRWRIDSLRHAVGVAAPMDHVEDLGMLTPPIGIRDYSSVFLILAGPYVFRRDWLVLKSAIEDDPTSRVLDMADEHGCIPMEKASVLLMDWGLHDRFHQDWLCRKGWFRLFDNRLVRWKGPVSDKLAFSLKDIGEPTTTQALLDHVGLVRSVNSTKNALASDDRFCRVSRTEWGLVSWGLPEYKGIASSIRSLLEHQGTVRINDVVDRLRLNFGTKDASVRAYCGAPAFVIEDGWVRLRGKDETHTFGHTPIRTVPGLFHLGPGRIGLLFRVDRDVLRGSGRPLSVAVGSALGVVPNQVAEFEVSTGGSLTVTLPDTSITGPTLGSTRLLAEAKKANIGDYLTLILDSNDWSAESTVFQPPVSETSWALVERLTGLRSGAGLPGLSEALGCDPEEVVQVLRRRGDDLVVEALPDGAADH